MKQLLSVLTVVTLLLAVVPSFAQDATEEPAAAPNIVELAADTGSLSTLVSAVEAAGLAETLSGGEFTVFAPTNGAFNTLLTELGLEAEALLADVETLTPILTYHVVPGTYTAADLLALADEAGGVATLETVNGAELSVAFDPEIETVTINAGEATVSQADITASNGVVHVIDNVLIPTPDEELSEEVEAEEADMGAMEATEEATMEATEEAAAAPNIVELAANTGSLSTLVSAVEAAGLAETLSGGEFTVFAPTNGAFNTLLTELGLEAEALLADVETLTPILTYHVVPGTYTAADLLALADEAGGVATLETVNGAEISVALDQDLNTVTINDGEAIVSQADITASNGVVHVIDNVLVPAPDDELPEETEAEATEEATMEADMGAMEATEEAAAQPTIVELAVNTGNLSTLVSAVEAAGLAETLSGGEFTVFAPTNGAFQTLITELDTSAEELLSDTEALTPILTYHVVPGTYTAADLLALADEAGGVATLETVNGAEISVALNQDLNTVTINDGEAIVSQADIAAANGVVHIIDNVLVPAPGQ